ncbi:MAG TPA: hypothetical protein VJN43_09030 [Bryobacteraceae bacterium]|nr:hypothetical protein [Bryobacteraceae bacterium]
MAREIRDKCVLAMIRGFFDETSDDVKVFMVCGWISRARRWQEFSDAWNDVLGTEPKLRYFRHHESMMLADPKSQFYNWSPQDRDGKLESLAAVFARHTPDYGMCSVLDLAPFLALIHQVPTSRKQLDSLIHGANPFMWAFHNLISSVLGYEVGTRVPPERVDFIFDENSALRTCIKEYEALRTKMPQELQMIAGSCAPADDKLVAALQGADLLCGELLDFEQGNESKPFRIMAESCDIIRTDVKPAEWPPFERMIRGATIFWAARARKKPLA